MYRAYEVAESYYLLGGAVSTSPCLSECVAAICEGKIDLPAPVTTSCPNKRIEVLTLAF